MILNRALFFIESCLRRQIKSELLHQRDVQLFHTAAHAGIGNPSSRRTGVEIIRSGLKLLSEANFPK